MIEFGQFFGLRLSVLKEEGQPKLATLFAFGCEPATICAVGTILPVATVSPFLSADLSSEVTSLREVRNSFLIQEASLARAVSDESLSREILKTVAGLLKNPAAEHSRG